jgi:hypothetical protein
MTTLPIDIALPDAITQRLTPPTCDDIKIPPPAKRALCLPFGGSFQSIIDVTKAVPDDCAVTFSILLQLPPMMASLGCFLKLLKVMKPLQGFVGGAPNVAKMAEAAAELIPIIADVVLCFEGIQAAIPRFVRDLIKLIAKLLKCLGEQLKSIAALMSGIQLSIQTAQAAGNQALLQQLQCAHDNANAQAQAALGSTDVIQLVLSRAEPLLGLMPGGAPTLTIPTFGSAQSAEELAQVASTMLSVGASLDQVAAALDGLGTC